MSILALCQNLNKVSQDRKNALEEYIYDTRGKLDDRYATYVKPEEKEKLLAALSEAEEWLYTEEGEEATKSVYVSRLDALRVLGDPITNRYREAEERSRNVSALRETINTYMTYAQSSDEKYAHIDAKEKEKIIEKCATIQHWLDGQVARQSERAKNVDPVLTGAELSAKRDEIIYFATPILTKPKPKPIPEPGKQEAPKQEAKTEEPVPEKAEDQGPPEMDVD
jgi:heat shock protein 4